jgi:3-hydroxymyristoyl/3-hydroxydecanoyl-(acyl carrier protein) dehydratase
VTRDLAWRRLPVDGPAGGAVQWRTTIPADYAFYDGHFDGYPVLAGGVQLHELVLPCLAASCGELPPVRALDGVKFLARNVPGDTIDVVLRRHAEPERIQFEIRRGETRCTTGRATFAAPVPVFSAAGAER